MKDVEVRKHPLAKCEECPLREERHAPSCNLTSKIALVSRSPGTYDVRMGEPFSNPRGSKAVTDHMFERNGFKRSDILLSNLVLCYSEDPPKEAIAACRDRLLSELENVETIIAAGVESVKEFIGNHAISTVRGLEHEKDGKRVIATSNPAVVVYDADAFPYLVEDFALALNPPPEVVYPEVTVWDSAKGAKHLLEQLIAYDGIIATDLEGHASKDSHIECAGFAFKGDEAHVITRRGILANVELFKELYESNKHFLWHNGVYDCKLLKKNGINSNIIDDTFPLSYVLDERTEGVHGLKYLARTQLGWKNYQPDEVEEFFETGEIDDPTQLYEYNGYDCAATFQLFSILKERAERDEVWYLYRENMLPFLRALVDIELRGFHYDHIAAADLNEELVIPELRRLTSEMRRVTGLELLKPSSPKQVSAWAYETCGLRHSLKDTRKRKLSTSFGKEVRTEILEDRITCKSHYAERLKEFAELHQSWAEIDKQRGTYIEGLIKLVAEDGKLYPTFNPCGTVTGRPSSRNPNFLNITRTGKNIVPAIRTLFKPSPGNVIVQGDYSQAELRVIAKLSGDNELLSIYRDTDRSLHRETAAAFYGKDYTKEQYVKSKNINFGVCYGQSAFAFAQMYHMPQEEAQAYIDNWFKKFPAVEEWIKQTHKIILKENYLANPFGRKRRFYLITEENLGDTLREGVNFLPQSTASDFTEAAVVELNALGVPVINTVYDSIIADVPASMAEEVARQMKSVMEEIPEYRLDWKDIPFKVDISWSNHSWGNVEEVELLAA